MRLYAEHVRLNQGGYDSRGRYFGRGEKLYRVTDASGAVDVRVRAPDAVSARARVARALDAQQRNPRQVHPETGERLPFREHHIEQHERGFLGAAGQAHCRQGMRLVYLPANQAFAFKFGDNLIDIENPNGTKSSRFFQTRAEAVAAARAIGLQVDGRGCVVAA